MHLAARGKHCPLLRLIGELTSVEQKGSVPPFFRVYTVPYSVKRRFRVCVLAAVFLDEVRQLDLEFVVGVRSTRRTLHPGEVTVADCPHGGDVELRNWPHGTLVLGRGDRVPCGFL